MPCDNVILTLNVIPCIEIAEKNVYAEVRRDMALLK